MSPHIGGSTQEAERRVMDVCGDNMLRVLDGGDPLNVVNGVSRRR
jgi:phosphoglycerate dehydrogenase-like enzyme